MKNKMMMKINPKGLLKAIGTKKFKLEAARMEMSEKEYEAYLKKEMKKQKPDYIGKARFE